MAQRTDQRDDEQDRVGRPVLMGLIALVAVAVVVGLVLGVAVLAGTKVVGLDESDTASDAQTAQETMVVPEPSLTDEPDDNGLGIAPDTSGPSTTLTPSSPTTSATPESTITLTAVEQSVSPMQNINMNISYPGGVGAVLQFQRRTNGTWTNFPVTSSVSSEQYTTFIQTGTSGVNAFRLLDTDSGATSNVVRVTVG